MARLRIPLSATRAADMPPVCVVCGSAVDVHVRRSFAWRPGWVKLGFFVSIAGAVPWGLMMLVVGVINGWGRAVTGGICCTIMGCIPSIVVLMVGLARTRRISLDLPVCDRHRNYWTWRGFLIFAPLFALMVIDLTVGVLLMIGVLPDAVFAYTLLGTAVLLLIWAAAAALLKRGELRADEITDDDMTLTPVHPMFAEQWRFRHLRDRASAADEWEEYDPYPRRPATPRR